MSYEPKPKFVAHPLMVKNGLEDSFLNPNSSDSIYSKNTNEQRKNETMSNEVLQNKLKAINATPNGQKGYHAKNMSRMQSLSRFKTLKFVYRWRNGSENDDSKLQKSFAL